MGAIAEELRKELTKEYHREYYMRNANHYKKCSRDWYKMNRDCVRSRYNEKYKTNVDFKLKNKLASMKYRYGISSVLVTLQDLMGAWVRDNADKMKQPSLVRIDLKGVFSIDNIKFIEFGSVTKSKVRKKNDNFNSMRLNTRKRVFKFMTNMSHIYNFVSWRDYVLNKSDNLKFIYPTALLRK